MSPTQGLFLGVDAGNSKTVAVLGTADGRIVGYGRAGVGDIYNPAGTAHAVTQVATAVDRAFAATEARLDRSALVHTAFCLAGIDWADDEQFWQEALAGRLRWPGTWSLRNDGFALLRAGLPGGTGVALGAGTGGVVTSRSPTGAEWSASFWITSPIGGGSLGEHALQAVVRAELGLGERTSLTTTLLHAYEQTDVAALLEAFTRRDRPGRLRFADAARFVLREAAGGDPLARAIVAEQARAYAAYARVAATRVGMEADGPIDVVLGGSVLTSRHGALREAAREALRTALPMAHVTIAPRPPALGALIESLAEGLGSLPQEVVSTLDAQPLPGDLFVT